MVAVYIEGRVEREDGCILDKRRGVPPSPGGDDGTSRVPLPLATTSAGWYAAARPETKGLPARRQRVKMGRISLFRLQMDMTGHH